MPFQKTFENPKLMPIITSFRPIELTLKNTVFHGSTGIEDGNLISRFIKAQKYWAFTHVSNQLQTDAQCCGTHKAGFEQV